MSASQLTAQKAAAKKEQERIQKREEERARKAQEAEDAAAAEAAAQRAREEAEIRGSARPGQEHLRVPKTVPRHYASQLKGDTGGNTRLMWACSHGMLGHVRDLLDQGVDVEAKNVDGWSALYYAIYNDRIDVVRMLLQRGAAANGHASDGTTPLMLAVTAGRGHVRLVGVLVDEFGAQLNTLDKNLWTALMRCARRGNWECAQAIMEYNLTDINAQGKKGLSALMMACHMGHLEVVRLMVHVPSYTPPRDPKKKLTKEEAAEAQRKADPDYQPTAEEILADAIKARALQVNLTDDEGYTALCYATQSTHGTTVDIVELLLTFPGINVNTPSKNYSNALTCACRIAHVDVVELLLKAGADCNLFESQRGTALITSVVDVPEMSSVDGLFWVRRRMIVEMLLEKLASTSVEDIDGRTPDQTADFYGQTDIAEYIRETTRAIERRMAGKR